MKTRYHRTTQKFGIELPKTVKRALEIDEETGTTFWRDALQKEMGTVMKAQNEHGGDMCSSIGSRGAGMGISTH